MRRYIREIRHLMSAEAGIKCLFLALKRRKGLFHQSGDQIKQIVVSEYRNGNQGNR